MFVQCFVWGGILDIELYEHVLLERVEMIARLTSEGQCKESDREIALNLIADLAKGNTLNERHFSASFDHYLKT